MLAGPVPIAVDSFAFFESRPGTDSFDLFVLCWATAATAVPVARHGPVLLRPLHQGQDRAFDGTAGKADPIACKSSLASVKLRV